MIDPELQEELRDAAAQLAVARSFLHNAKARARAAANCAAEQGVYETVISTELGVDRMTTRRWLGKQK